MLKRLTHVGLGLLALAALAAAQSSYQAISVVNPGTITGKVTWSGPRPHIPSLTITKDAPICDPENQKTRDLERLVIGSEGGVANTVVFLKNVTRGKEFDLQQPKPMLDQTHCRYVPHILLVPEKATLQMRSSDATLHTIHMDGAATYNLPFPFPNQVISRPMTTSGLVNLRCNGGHVWMNAEIFVAPNPYYAVTDEAGRFELTDVPPGEYEIVAWHEGWGVVGQETSFDVLTQRRVQRPVFTPPRTLSKAISVGPNATTTADFVFSAR